MCFLGFYVNISTSEAKSAQSQQWQGIEPFLLYGVFVLIGVYGIFFDGHSLWVSCSGKRAQAFTASSRIPVVVTGASALVSETVFQT